MSVDATIGGDEPFAPRTGRGVRVAVADSGVNLTNPHIVTRPAGGVAIDSAGRASADYTDRLGHGTAVMAAIQEKAPDAEYYAIKLFDRELSTDVGALVRAIGWATAERCRVVNLSLGTSRSEHAAPLARALTDAAAHGVIVISACAHDGVVWLPGALPGALPVELDWACPRDRLRARLQQDGRWLLCASGYARPIAGVPPERNLKGVSFAVANVTGFALRALEQDPSGSAANLARRLASAAMREPA